MEGMGGEGVTAQPVQEQGQGQGQGQLPTPTLNPTLTIGDAITLNVEGA